MRTGRRSGAKSKVDCVTGTSGTLCELPKRSPHLTRQNERCHENASDCLRLDRCGGDAGDASTCSLLKRLPSRRTMPGALRSVPAILWSTPTILRPVAVLRPVALLWSVAQLWPAPATLWSNRLLLRRIRLRWSGDHRLHYWSNHCRSHCRGSPFSPIQNNSDLAQGLLPIRPSKVRRDDIHLWRQEGYMAPKPKPVRSVFTVGMVLAMALTILAAMTWAVAEPGLSLIYRSDLPLLY